MQNMAFVTERSAKLNDLIRSSEVLALQGDPSTLISGIAYHSAKVEPGYLFVAIPGESSDGHEYIEKALRQGAAAVICEKDIRINSPSAVAVVSDSRLALANAAARFYGHPSRKVNVVGITGTNGKTTTTYLLESIFREAGYTPGVIGTINYRYGGKSISAGTTTPQSLDLQKLMQEMVESGVTHIFMEVSSHALTQKRVDGVAFAMVVFTNLTHDHLDYHQTMDEYFNAKSRLFDLISDHRSNRSVSIINGDDEYGVRLDNRCRQTCISYGTGANSHYRVSEIESTLDGLKALITGPDISCRIESQLVGTVNIYNILAAASVAFESGLDAQTVKRGVKALRCVPGRLFPIKGKEGITAFIDYAHTPDALSKALGSIKALAPKRLITVFGCGGDRDRAKRPLMGRIAGEAGDIAVVTSDNPRGEDPLDIIRAIEAGLRDSGMLPLTPGRDAAKKGYYSIPDRAEAIRFASAIAKPGDVILIAGKGHENYQIIGNTVREFDDAAEVRKAFRVSGHGKP